MRRRLLCCSLSALLAACGDGGPVVVSPPPPAEEISVHCQPAGFSAGAGCATSACTVGSRNFTGDVTLSCASQPLGLRCDFGPNPVRVAAGGQASTGFTVAADLTVPARVHPFEVVATSGVLRRTTMVTVEVGSAPPPRPSSSHSMMIVGCAGYADFGLNRQLTFAPAIAGAWRDRFASFCTQTDTRADGRFDLEVPERCYRRGEFVYLTAGGTGTCVAVPFEAGSTQHVVLIGRQGCAGPRGAAPAE
jgi:hypothetical protein